MEIRRAVEPADRTAQDREHRARVLVLVAAHGLTGGAVDVAEPVQAAPGQHPVRGRGRDPGQGRELDRAQAFTQPQ